MKKTKILVLADHPLSPSGVGTQTKYMIDALLKTNRYQFICLGGAMKHTDYSPTNVDPWGEDWRIIPIDGYGNPEIIRSVIHKEKPDVLWFMTDPRFYEWLWEIENEVRSLMPMVYYHVWDNYPAPEFNGKWYRSTDEIVAISKVTHGCVKEVVPDTSLHYLPHSVPTEIFHPCSTPEETAQVDSLREQIINTSVNHRNPKKKIFFWNSRNARRKQPGTLIWWFKEFIDEVGHDKACLLMHTDARDPHGQDLPHILNQLNITDGQVLLSTNKISPEELSHMYRAADFTIGISDAEGFGLSTLESLTCGTPIIVNMTGGLQEQVTDGTKWFGWGIQPSSKAVIGSLQVPYIYEDRIAQKDFTNVLKKAIKLSKPKYEKMSKEGLEHIKNNYSFEDYQSNWVKLMDEIVEKHGSWETRKNYKRWHLLEVA
jgi:glycosyltransferase involved in cell wall biosynthesis